MNEKIQEIVQGSERVLIIQADNPDGDSLGSALALESIMGNLGKQTLMYCGVDMPGYLRYLRGWDRVSNELPTDFDMSFVVDVSTMTLLEKLSENGGRETVANKPCVVLDHHGSVEKEIPFADVLINNPDVSSTGELIYHLSKQCSWPVDALSGSFIMAAILGDTQGLSNSQTKSETYRVMSELTELGVDRPALEEQRRELSKMPQEIFNYKARLIERTEFHAENQLALVDIPHSEIMEFSPLYNPAPLIQSDMLQTEGVGIAVVLKHYRDGKILGAIRTNPQYPVGSQLAEHFGGGGHLHASGFKIQDGRSLESVKSECIRVATELIDTLELDKPDETIQYTYSTN